MVPSDHMTVLRFTIGPLKAIKVFLLKYIGTVLVYFDKKGK